MSPKLSWRLFQVALHYRVWYYVTIQRCVGLCQGRWGMLGRSRLLLNEEPEIPHSQKGNYWWDMMIPAYPPKKKYKSNNHLPPAVHFAVYPCQGTQCDSSQRQKWSHPAITGERIAEDLCSKSHFMTFLQALDWLQGYIRKQNGSLW
jgi:hypothetical protein